jgi:hypothetical protein
MKSKDIEQGEAIDIIKSLQELREEDVVEVIEVADEIFQIIGKKDLQMFVEENKCQTSIT